MPLIWPADPIPVSTGTILDTRLTPPSKRLNQCDSSTGPSTSSKKPRTTLPAQETKHDSNETSSLVLNNPLQPSPIDPEDVPNTLQLETDTVPSDDTARPHRNRHPPKKLQ